MTLLEAAPYRACASRLEAAPCARVYEISFIPASRCRARATRIPASRCRACASQGQVSR